MTWLQCWGRMGAEDASGSPEKMQTLEVIAGLESRGSKASEQLEALQPSEARKPGAPDKCQAGGQVHGAQNPEEEGLKGMVRSHDKRSGDLMLGLRNVASMST